MAFFSNIGIPINHPAEKNVVFATKTINYEVKSKVVNVSYRYGNTLRFPRARDEPPHSLWGLIDFAFPQDKESFFEKHRTQKKRFSFSRSLGVFPSLALCFSTSSHLLLGQTMSIYFCDG